MKRDEEDEEERRKAVLIRLFGVDVRSGGGEDIGEEEEEDDDDDEAFMELKKSSVPVRLFGVDVRGGSGAAEVDEEEEEAVELKKSSSMPNLSLHNPLLPPGKPAGGKGYASDEGDLASPHQKRRRRKAQERKKGIPWTEEEHRKFLDGLRQLGKGDWRGVSKNFVTSRTATQVASHAQKYFLRQTNPGKKKRRASLFDVGIVDFHGDQLPSPQSVTSKPAPILEIIHTDRGDVPIPSYPTDAGGFRGNDMQVYELSDYVKRSMAPAEMSLTAIGSGLEMASSVSSLELSIGPPRGAAEAITVL